MFSMNRSIGWRAGAAQLPHVDPGADAVRRARQPRGGLPRAHRLLPHHGHVAEDGARVGAGAAPLGRRNSRRRQVGQIAGTHHHRI